MEFDLAQCLHGRNEPGDADEALIHASRAVAGNTADSKPWILYSRIQEEVSGTDAAMKVIEDAKRKVPANGNLFAVYQAGASMLVNATRRSEALGLLREGIARVMPEKSLFSLYEAAADILVDQNELAEAIRILNEGIKRIAPQFNLTILFQKLGLIYCRAGAPRDAIQSQIEGHALVSNAYNGYKLIEGAMFYCGGLGDADIIEALLSGEHRRVTDPQESLGRILVSQVRGDWSVAGEIARSARRKFPRYGHFAAMDALGHLAAKSNLDARRSIESFPNFRRGRGLVNTWLHAFILLRVGTKDEASKSIAEYLGRAIDRRSELNEAFLLRLWKQQLTGPESHNLCFRLPILPACVTGLNRDEHRVPFASALPLEAASITSTNLPPKPIGSYVIETTLGKGESAEVFRARHIENGNLVALKVMQFSGNPRREATFQRERDSLFRLNQSGMDGVVTVLDMIQEADGHHVLVLEFADGGNLERYVTAKNGGKLALGEIQEIAESIVRTMTAVHEKKIIHRDLKPANILLVDQKWKIADFGIAKYLDRPFTSLTLQKAHTPGYSAPEQVAGIEAAGSADIYSFGKILLFMATGSPDFDGLKTVMDNALRALIKQCIEHDPSDRPTSMVEIRDRLKYVGTR